jgi:hypothetical protein
MNNYEPSVEASSTDTFTALRSYVYSSSWNNSPDESLQNDPSFYIGRNNDGVVKIEYSAPVHDVQALPGLETRPRL